ncbi:MAG: VacJ family lipoprotein [Desulfuromonadales bacterium]|nr:VacJ family lipoprotein [Desulfuromonadales bacterium]
MNRLMLLLLLLLLWLPSAVAAQGELEEEEWTDFDDPFAEVGAVVTVVDPIEPFNRAMFWVNDRLYFYLLKPAARGYRVVPAPTRESVDHFFANLSAPVRLVNSLLQGKFAAAGNETRRFLFNSTLGVLGFFDPASRRGWPTAEEDFGQTLGHWGVGSGFYLVLPLFGPSNVRDGIGRVGDSFLDPVPYAVNGLGESIAIKVYDRVNWLSLDDDSYEKMKEQALDTYLFIRDAYSQRREALIRK